MQRCMESKSCIVQSQSGKLRHRNRKHLREEKSTATMNPEVSTPPLVASLESIRDSTVGVMTHQITMGQTSTVTTDDKHVAPKTHQGSLKISRFGHMIRPSKRFRDENIPYFGLSDHFSV